MPEEPLDGRTIDEVTSVAIRSLSFMMYGGDEVAADLGKVLDLGCPGILGLASIWAHIAVDATSATEGLIHPTYVVAHEGRLAELDRLHPADAAAERFANLSAVGKSEAAMSDAHRFLHGAERGEDVARFLGSLLKLASSSLKRYSATLPD